jgi:hypothetical protein
MRCSFGVEDEQQRERRSDHDWPMANHDDRETGAYIGLFSTCVKAFDE